MADGGNDFDKIKRQANDLIADLHARGLAIPAGILLALIVAALFVLPKSPAGTPVAQIAPTVDVTAQTGDDDLTKMADISMVSAVPLKSEPQTYGQENPFMVDPKVKCVVTKSSVPRRFSCVIGASVVTYRCNEADDTEICNGAEGPTGGGGGTGSTGSPDGGAPPDGGTEEKKKTTYYVVDVEFNGKTITSVEAGDVLPTSGSAVVFYAGPNSSGSKAIFVLADGVEVQGAEADPELGTFELSAGDEVVLTTSAGVVHQLALNKIRKVTK